MDNGLGIGLHKLNEEILAGKIGVIMILFDLFIYFHCILLCTSFILCTQFSEILTKSMRI
jgi:hypothetical protein